ncbi:MAG: hypothetical protein BWK76_18325 [Desulfobulbaceae bacterium A2]|nr:MAG: hypothetical protein BWK76_18325 [Desulfobulbaceae bacterium A2]
MRRIVITVGESSSDTDPEVVIETFLGSCVGLACYDATRRIGGLIHMLLPEGTQERELERPCAYVRSGIPYLLARLEELGARRESLRAYLAGGARICSVQGDIDLHIGMRNILAVKCLLQELAIPLEIGDSGGHFGRTMRLFLADGRVEVCSFSAGVQRISGVDGLAGPGEVELRQAIAELKPASRIALDALDAARDPAASFHSIERLVLQDQVLTASLFKLVNSSWYGLPRKLGRISESLAFLGLEGFRKLVLQSCLHTFYSRKLSGYAMEDGVLFEHAVGCARIAEMLAEKCGTVEREDAYLAGLVHDIGKVVLERCCSARIPALVDLMLTRNLFFYQAERALLGLDHGQAGAMLAAEWRLAPSLAEAIRLHHDPTAASSADMRLVAIIHLADHICNTCGIGISLSTGSNPLNSAALAVLRLDTASIEEILNAIPSRLAF